MNINSKFTGSGGSTHNLIQTLLRSHLKNICQFPNPQSPAFSDMTSIILNKIELLAKPHSLENIMSEVISQLL